MPTRPFIICIVRPVPTTGLVGMENHSVYARIVVEAENEEVLKHVKEAIVSYLPPIPQP